MQLAPARALLAKINRIVDDLGTDGTRASRLELDLLREYVRRFYETLDTDSPQSSPPPKAPATSPAATEPALDFGHVRETFAPAAQRARAATAESPTARPASRPKPPALIEVPEDVERDVRELESAERRNRADSERLEREHAERERAERERGEQLAREREARDRNEREERARAAEAAEAAEAAQRDRETREATERERREQSTLAQLARDREAERRAAEHSARERELAETAAREQAARLEAIRSQEAPSPYAGADDAAHAPGYAPATAAIDDRELRELFTLERATDLSDRLANSPVTDLSRAMALNEQLQVRRELFGGSQELMGSTLTRLNGLGSFEEAVRVMLEPARQFDWAEEERRPTARTFVKLVRRRYP